MINTVGILYRNDIKDLDIILYNIAVIGYIMGRNGYRYLLPSLYWRLWVVPVRYGDSVKPSVGEIWKMYGFGVPWH